jgi:hypothetical protein
MNLVRTFSTLTLFLGASLLPFSLAQAPNMPPSEWSHSLEIVEGATVGSEMDIIFKAIIPNTFHVYSNDYECPNGGPLPSEFKFDASTSYELVGKARPVGAKMVFDDIFECNVSEFHHEAMFRQRIKVMQPSLRIKGVLEYQMCAESGLCVLHKYPFELNSVIEAAPKK